MISTRTQKTILFMILLLAITLSGSLPLLRHTVAYAQDTGATSSESGSLEEELRKQREENNRKNDCVAKDGGALTKENCGIINYILIFTRVLSGLVGIVIVIMLVVRGMQYIVARENPQLTAKAREGILWAVLALILYLFVFALLQWLVPGGVL